MKNILFAFLFAATCLGACQQENQTSPLDQKRQELESKRQELKEKQELAALTEEMKNVKAEIDKVDKKKESPTVALTGRIQGDNVILRTGPAVQFDKYDNFINGETVRIISRQVSNYDGQIWYQVSRDLKQQSGWVFGKFLVEI